MMFSARISGVSPQVPHKVPAILQKLKASWIAGLCSQSHRPTLITIPIGFWRIWKLFMKNATRVWLEPTIFVSMFAAHGVTTCDTEDRVVDKDWVSVNMMQLNYWPSVFVCVGSQHTNQIARSLLQGCGFESSCSQIFLFVFDCFTWD